MLRLDVSWIYHNFSNYFFIIQRIEITKIQGVNEPFLQVKMNAVNGIPHVPWPLLPVVMTPPAFNNLSVSSGWKGKGNSSIPPNTREGQRNMHILMTMEAERERRTKGKKKKRRLGRWTGNSKKGNGKSLGRFVSFFLLGVVGLVVMVDQLLFLGFCFWFCVFPILALKIKDGGKRKDVGFGYKSESRGSN